MVALMYERGYYWLLPLFGFIVYRRRINGEDSRLGDTVRVDHVNKAGVT